MYLVDPSDFRVLSYGSLRTFGAKFLSTSHVFAPSHAENPKLNSERSNKHRRVPKCSTYSESKFRNTLTPRNRELYAEAAKSDFASEY